MFSTEKRLKDLVMFSTEKRPLTEDAIRTPKIAFLKYEKIQHERSRPVLSSSKVQDLNYREKIHLNVRGKTS